MMPASPDIRVNFAAFGIRVRQRRHALGLTQCQLAEDIGVSPQFIGELERGVGKPSLVTLLGLCYALDCSPNLLLQDSLPEMIDGSPLPLRQPFGLLRNTLSNWVLVDTPDDALRGDDHADLSRLPPLAFRALDEDAPAFPCDLPDDTQP